MDREKLSKLSELCTEAIKKGDTDGRNYAVVYLYSKLCEMEVGLNTLLQSTSSLEIQSKSPFCHTFETLIRGEDEEQETTSTDDSETIQGEFPSYTEGSRFLRGSNWV